MTTTSPPTTPSPAASERPRLASGTELIGEFEGSGFKRPPRLVRRGDGQTVQLTELLYLVAKSADGTRSYEDIAADVTRDYDKQVSAENVRTLVEDKLRPLGVMTLADGSEPALEKSDPLLALRFRKQIVPPGAARAVSAPFKPLFWPPVALAALVAFVAVDVWLFGHHGVAQALRQAMYDPALMIALFGLVVVAAGWHEFGHAAGCAYGGACPGGMGAGLYLAYPAFYTDVTDAYRLDRKGRLRTDLAGVYFNIVFVLAMAGLYFVTHWEPLLLVIVVEHFEMVHQLLPLLRLDGYYIIADLTGVPDLFTRIGPILKSALPWNKPDEKVTALKSWVRVVVTVWVLIVVPLLFFQLLMLLLHLPRILATGADSLGHQVSTMTKGFGHGNIGKGLVALFQGLVLMLPLAGIVLTIGRLGGRTWRWGWTRNADAPAKRAAFVLIAGTALAGLIYVWLPNGDYKPINRRERGTLVDGVRAIEHVSTGRSSLESRQTTVESTTTTTETSTTTTTLVGHRIGNDTNTTVRSTSTSTTERRTTSTTADLETSTTSGATNP